MVAFLQAHDCEEAQGYYFSRPVPPQQFAKLLETGLTFRKLFQYAPAYCRLFWKGSQVSVQLARRGISGSLAERKSRVAHPGSNKAAQNIHRVTTRAPHTTNADNIGRL